MKRLALMLARLTGLLWLWRIKNRHAVVILTVHGVMARSDDDRWFPLRARLSPAQLDRSLSLLRQWYRFVPLDAAVDMLAGRRAVERYSIALTFDDGYRNQIVHALPVLQKHGITPTIFVSTGHAESQQPFWFDRLDYALQTAPADGLAIRVGGRDMRLRAQTREELAASYAAVRAAAKAAERDDAAMRKELDDLAIALEQRSGCRLSEIADRDLWSAVLTPDEIAASAGSVDFGSHTVDHSRIHRLADDACVYQLRRSKEAIERWASRTCRYFCYPDGGYSDRAASLVRECGYAAAVTTEPGLNRRGDDLMTLRRVDLSADDSGHLLLGRVCGLFS